MSLRASSPTRDMNVPRIPIVDEIRIIETVRRLRMEPSRFRKRVDHYLGAYGHFVQLSDNDQLKHLVKVAHHLDFVRYSLAVLFFLFALLVLRFLGDNTGVSDFGRFLSVLVVVVAYRVVWSFLSVVLFRAQMSKLAARTFRGRDASTAQ